MLSGGQPRCGAECSRERAPGSLQGDRQCQPQVLTGPHLSSRLFMMSLVARDFRYDKVVRGYVHVMEGDSITTRIQLPGNDRTSRKSLHCVLSWTANTVGNAVVYRRQCSGFSLFSSSWATPAIPCPASVGPDRGQVHCGDEVRVGYVAISCLTSALSLPSSPSPSLPPPPLPPFLPPSLPLQSAG